MKPVKQVKFPQGHVPQIELRPSGQRDLTLMNAKKERLRIFFDPVTALVYVSSAMPDTIGEKILHMSRIESVELEPEVVPEAPKPKDTAKSK